MIRQVPDLVEEQASVVRYLELTGAIRPGVGEGPFYVSEQLALEQRLRDSAISTGTMASSLRGDSRCISRASISLPVPFSPVINILASVLATFSISIRSCCMALLSPQNIPLSLDTNCLLPTPPL